MNPPLGRCYWAVAPFAPSPPFEIYVDGDSPQVVASAARMGEAARNGSSQFKLVMPVKVRPVLVVSNVLPPYDEVLALRLCRFDKLTAEEQQVVREQKDEKLFRLRPDDFPGLKIENAAMVTTLIKIPYDAIDTSEELGAVNENELSVLHERFARTHGLRLDAPIAAQAKKLMALARAQESGD